MQCGRTPLHLAALQNKAAVVALLLQQGAPVNVADENGLQPLHKAAVQGSVEAGEELLRAGASVGAPLQVLAKLHRLTPAVIFGMLSHNMCVQDGTTPLHLASWKGRDEMVKLLLLSGAPVQVWCNPLAFTSNNGFGRI